MAFDEIAFLVVMTIMQMYGDYFLGGTRFRTQEQTTFIGPAFPREIKFRK
jgi:hypothetical protein